MPFPAIPTRIVCPQCHETFVAPVRSIVDVGQEPELKEQFLAGALNRAICPKCGGGGMLTTPMIYHDPAKELLITYVPTELNMSAQEQEKLVGSLVNAVMNNVPSEQRKAYFFRPQTAMTIEGLYDAVLEADGISKEMLEAQRARIRLINSLLEALDDDVAFDTLVEEHRAEFSYGFFLMLSEILDSQEQAGAQDGVDDLRALRDKLLSKVTPGSMSEAEDSAETPDALIALLMDSQPGEPLRRAILTHLPQLDYGFFEVLTARIEEAQQRGDAATAQQLTELRQRIVDELNAQRRMAHQAEDDALLLIMDLLEADSVMATLRQRQNELNDLVFVTLARLRERAQGRNDAKRVARLDALSNAAQEVLEEQLPPEVRLIGRLMRAEYPDGSDGVLNAHRGLLNSGFLKNYDAYVTRIEGEGEPELANKLKDIRKQIVAKMTILRA